MFQAWQQTIDMSPLDDGLLEGLIDGNELQSPRLNSANFVPSDVETVNINSADFVSSGVETVNINSADFVPPDVETVDIDDNSELPTSIVAETSADDSSIIDPVIMASASNTIESITLRLLKQLLGLVSLLGELDRKEQSLQNSVDTGPDFLKQEKRAICINKRR